MIDLHSDTIYRLWEEGEERSLLSNDLMIDKARLEMGGVIAQCFALFVPMYDVRLKRDEAKSPWQILSELYGRFKTEIHKASIKQLFYGDPICQDSLQAVLTTEEGASIEGDLSRLSTLKTWGVRIFGFTWNFENELGYPNSKDRRVMASGLKSKGFEALEECERLGIVVDVSHLSDGGFWDVVRHSRKPFVATHSNSRAITPSSRNLDDDMLVALSDKGGLTGLNLCPAFLRTSSTPDGASLISDMIIHVKHILNVAGEDVLAIGTDFDGISGSLEISSPDKMILLKNAMKKEGIPSRIIDKIFVGNAMRILK